MVGTEKTADYKSAGTWKSADYKSAETTGRLQICRDKMKNGVPVDL